MYFVMSWFLIGIITSIMLYRDEKKQFPINSSFTKEDWIFYSCFAVMGVFSLIIFLFAKYVIRGKDE